MENLLLAGLLTYLYASIPFPYLIGLARGVDIAKSGSKNLGTTNLTRLTGSKKIAILSGFLDGTKGVVAVFIALIFDCPAGILFIFAILGQMYSVITLMLTKKWQGGKGIASTFGFLVFYNFWFLIIFTTIFVLSCRFTHYISVSSTLALVSLNIMAWTTGDIYFIFGSLVVTGLSLFKHRGNYSRLKNGTEPQVWLKK